MSDDERPRLDTSDIVERGVHAPTPRRAVWAKRIAWLAVLVVIVAASSAITNSLHRADRADTRADAAVDTAVDNGDAATSLADKVLRQCGTGTAAAKELKARGLCTSASDTKDVVAKPGPQGVAGPAGEPGETGQAGSNGARGATGARGAAGVAGAMGVAGAPGAAGATGAQGQKGDTGDRGATGSQGPKGDTGATGAQGPAGQSAYPFAFTFVVPGLTGDTTYVCTVSEPGDPGSCAQS